MLYTMLTIPAMSVKYGIPATTLYSAARAGRLPATKSGATWLVEDADAEQFAATWKPREVKDGRPTV